MKLVNMTVADFVELLASEKATAPGGGSTAALHGALGSALINMVAGLTTGKAKFEEVEPLMLASMEKASKIKLQFIDVIDRDTEAFNTVSAVFSMPKETDDDKVARKVAMQLALKACTKTPFEMMELSLEALELTREVLGKTNANAASDLGVSALSLKAAVQGAWLNVLINIGGIKDEAFVEEYRSNGEKILAKTLTLADEIYDTILKSL